MTKARLEAFSDGVIAILITIMVLELKVPHEASWDALRPMAPVFLSYVLSFLYLGIYWSNHHHLFHAVRTIRGGVLWANLHLLFWLSLIPFTTAWMGEDFKPLSVAMYGADLLAAAIAYWIMVRVLLRHHESDSTLARAIGKDFKGTISIVCYVVALAFAALEPWIACGLYIAVALMWLVPDRRIERLISE